MAATITTTHRPIAMPIRMTTTTTTMPSMIMMITMITIITTPLASVAFTVPIMALTTMTQSTWIWLITIHSGRQAQRF